MADGTEDPAAGDAEPGPAGPGRADAEPDAGGEGDGADAGDRRVQLAILLLMAGGAVYLLVRLLAPFLPALVTSAVLAVLVYPAYGRFEAWLGRRGRWLGDRNVAAFVGTVVVFFVILVPLLGLSLVLVQQIAGGVDWAAGQIASMLGPGGTLRGWVAAGADRLGVDEARIAESLGAQLQGVVSLLTARTLSFLSGLGGWLLQAGAALFTLFYLLRDADGIVRVVQWLVPLEGAQTDRLFDRARDVIHATVYGNIVVAGVQGGLGGLAFWVLGIPAAALWGTVMGVLSLLPVISAPLVWLPAGLLLVAQGRVAEGVGLLLFGALVVSTVDNYLRAVLVSDRARLHPLAVFFSVLGGLFLFGAVGLFVGPVLFVVGVSLVEMARLAVETGDGDRRGPPPAILTEGPDAGRP